MKKPRKWKAWAIVKEKTLLSIIDHKHYGCLAFQDRFLPALTDEEIIRVELREVKK